MGLNPRIYVVDDEEGILRFIRNACVGCAGEVQCFPSADGFLAQYDDSGDYPRCLVLDVRLPGMSGLELHRLLVDSRTLIPVILLSGAGDIRSAVESIRLGAVDFLEKPVSRTKLLENVERGLAIDSERRIVRKQRRDFQQRLNSLSKRELEVCEFLKQCKSTKQIAAEMHIGFQTAAKHRSNVFRKLNVTTESEFMQLVLKQATPADHS